MDSKNFKIYALATIMAVMALVGTSCTYEHDYSDPLWGEWILAYDEVGAIDPYYAEIYNFRPNGTGYLDWVDDWGRHYVDDFTWSARGEYLDIYYYNGSSEYYCFYFRNGNLVLWDGYNPYRYREYWPYY